MKTPNYRAMQAAGAAAQKNKQEPAHLATPMPYGDPSVLPRYMAGGSRHADLSKLGKR